MAVVSARRLLLWKAIAFFSFGLAASAVAWAFRPRGTEAKSKPDLIVVKDPSPVPDPSPVLGLAPTGTSPLRQTDRGKPIVVNIDELGLPDSQLEEWVQVLAPDAKNRGEFPTPRFSAHHHHH